LGKKSIIIEYVCMKNKKTTSTLLVDKKIELLRDAEENMLTEDTVKNLAKQIRVELIKEERYEEIKGIDKMVENFLKRFKNERENMVKNVGLNDKQTKELLELVGLYTKQSQN